MTCETCIISWAAYVYTCGTVYPGFFFFCLSQNWRKWGNV